MSSLSPTKRMEGFLHTGKMGGFTTDGEHTSQVFLGEELVRCEEMMKGQWGEGQRTTSCT